MTARDHLILRIGWLQQVFKVGAEWGPPGSPRVTPGQWWQTWRSTVQIYRLERAWPARWELA